MKIGVERIGQRTSAEYRPSLFGKIEAVTLTVSGTCETASQHIKSPGLGRRGRKRLLTKSKKLGSVREVSKWPRHAKTCQVGTSRARKWVRGAPSGGVIRRA
jgi:hypothetical protein